MKISLIYAVSQNSVIGKDNKLPWTIKADLQRFKALTIGKPVIMGRKTWESIGSKPLPNRTNAIVSTTMKLTDFKTRDLGSSEINNFNSLDSAIKYYREEGLEEVFVIGGKSLIEEAFPVADNIYLTVVQQIVPLSETTVRLNLTSTVKDNGITTLELCGVTRDFSFEHFVNCEEHVTGSDSIKFTFVDFKAIK